MTGVPSLSNSPSGLAYHAGFHSLHSNKSPFDITAWRKLHSCIRPYHGEITGSRLISKVKHRRAWVVLGWVTTWEVRVL